MASLSHPSEDEPFGLPLSRTEDAPCQVPWIGADPGEALDPLDDDLRRAHDGTPDTMLTVATAGRDRMGSAIPTMQDPHRTRLPMADPSI